MEFVIWLIVGLVVGGAGGAFATWWVGRTRGGAASVMQLKQENEKFRSEVTEHFVETARLINQMTDSYKQVFDHLSSGAEKLVDDKKLAERLPPSSGQEVRLSHFGVPGAADSARSGSGPGRSTDAESGSGARKPDNPDPLKSRASPREPEAGRQSARESSTGDPTRFSTQSSTQPSTRPAAGGRDESKPDQFSDKSGTSRSSD